MIILAQILHDNFLYHYSCAPLLPHLVWEELQELLECRLLRKLGSLPPSWFALTHFWPVKPPWVQVGTEQWLINPDQSACCLQAAWQGRSHMTSLSQVFSLESSDHFPPAWLHNSSSLLLSHLLPSFSSAFWLGWMRARHMWLWEKTQAGPVSS